MSIEFLYKYGRLNEHSEALFSTDSIWLSSAAELNDPFECTPSFIFTHEPEKIMAQLIRTIRNNNPNLTDKAVDAEAAAIYLNGRHQDPEVWESLKIDLISTFRHRVGLYCLTERRDSILMWSHYAADHNGYCIEFQATDYTPVFGTSQQVSYSTEYPEIDFYNTSIDDKIKLAFLTKCADWNYEKEWRIIDHEHGSGGRRYPPELMKGVIFGLRMQEKHKTQIREWIARRGTPVEFYQAIQSKNKFEFTVEEVL
jgi:hypothetical protein